MKFENQINDLLREQALVGLSENDVIDHTMKRCRETLLQLGEQYGNERAFKLAALIECADEMIDEDWRDDDPGDVEDYESGSACN